MVRNIFCKEVQDPSTLLLVSSFVFKSYHFDSFLDGKKHGPPGANLFIFHLPNDLRDSDLEKLFSDYGEVISARVNTRPDGTSKGFGKQIQTCK